MLVIACKFWKAEAIKLESILNMSSSMIPATLLVTRYPAHRVIPAAMTLWGIFTLLCFRAKSFSELAGYRFMVGILEGKIYK